MQIAAFLSDLSSLNIAPHTAALAMVTVHKPNSTTTSAELTPSNSASAQDPDIQRANELVSLHYAVKVKHRQSGLDEELLWAREKVNDVLRALS
jgi:hypothetical protein